MNPSATFCLPMTKWWGQNSVASTGFTIVLRCAYAQASLVRGASSAKNIITVDFCLCGAILNLNAFCFGAIPDIMIELIALCFFLLFCFKLEKNLDNKFRDLLQT
jgi:type IV secretory pathway VirB3-like protein